MEDFLKLACERHGSFFYDFIIFDLIFKTDAELQRNIKTETHKNETSFNEVLLTNFRFAFLKVLKNPIVSAPCDFI